MVQHDNFDVTIDVNGQAAMEWVHDRNDEVIPQKNPRVITRYIEACGGSEFTVFHSAKASQPGLEKSRALSVQVMVDGEEQAIGLAKKRDNFTTTVAGRGFYENGEYFQQKFIFDKLVTHDDILPNAKGIESFNKQLKHLGTIEINIYRIAKINQANAPTYSRSPATATATAVAKPDIHERLLKESLRTHRTSFGPAKHRPTKRFYNSRYIDHAGKPFLTFRFLYRSRNSLQKLGFIPCATATTAATATGGDGGAAGGGAV